MFCGVSVICNMWWVRIYVNSTIYNYLVCEQGAASVRFEVPLGIMVAVHIAM